MDTTKNKGMIKEHRIGNLVTGIYEDENGKEHETICRIMAIDETESLGDGWNYLLESISIERADIYDNIKPIPLTEDWLLRAGFEKIGVNLAKNGFTVWYSTYAKGYVVRYYFVGSESEKTVLLEYLHQIQNIFYCLTGEELTFKN